VSKTANDITKNLGNDAPRTRGVITDKINKENAGRRNQVAVLGVHVTHLSLDLFVSVFLMAKILDVTNGSIGAVGLFNLVFFAALILAFWLASYVVKKISRVWCVRISILLSFIAILLILLLQSQLAEVYIMLAAVYGASQGIYWASMHTFTTETLGGKRMAGFVAWHVVLASAMRIIFPFTVGALIEYTKEGFGTAVLVMLVISLIELAFTFVMLEQRKSESAGLSMRKFFGHLRKEGQMRRTWSLLFAQLLFPLQGLITLCITVLIFLEFKSNFTLGLWSSVFAGVAILTIGFYKLIKSPRVKIITFYAASFIPLACAVALLFSVTPVTIIVCQAGFVGFRVVVGLELDKTRLNMMSDIGADHLHTEGLLFTEIGYFVVRVAACALIIYAASFGALFFQILVVAFIATVPLSAILIHLWKRKYLTPQTEPLVVPPRYTKKKLN